MTTTEPERLVARTAARELGAAFKALMGAVRRLRSREARAGGGMSDAQYSLLFGLFEGEALSTGELAALADLAPATATEMLEALERDGLVARERSQRDRRVVLTSLTEPGRALLAKRHAVFAPRFNAALEPFSDEQLHTAAMVLDAMRSVFDES